MLYHERSTNKISTFCPTAPKNNRENLDIEFFNYKDPFSHIYTIEQKQNARNSLKTFEIYTNDSFFTMALLDNVYIVYSYRNMYLK